MSTTRARQLRWLPSSLIVLALLGPLIVVLLLSLRPVAWQLNLQARTEVLRLELIDPQSWQLGDAVVCVHTSRQNAANLPDLPSSNDPVCQGRQWHKLETDGLAGRGALSLSPNSGAPITAQIETSRSGELHMALRHTNPDESLGVLLSQDSGQVAAPLGSQVNIIWPAITLKQAAHQDEGGVVVLPFSGSAIVGRDISWSSQSMLISGEISVFSASENHLTGRTVAEHSILMLGDRVDIEAFAPPAVTPKGFVRIDRLSNSPQERAIMDVVAYAPAEQVTIHRYGGGNYQFEASWWVRLKHQSSLLILLLVLTGLLSVLNSLVTIVPGCRQFFNWCRTVSGPDDGPPEKNESKPRA